jgi:hypothetical protein
VGADTQNIRAYPKSQKSREQKTKLMKNRLRYLIALLPLITGTTSFGQYCTPNAGSNGCVYGDYISNVVFGSISNPSGCSGGSYGNYTAQSTTLDLGSTQSIAVSLNPDFNQGIGVFIDWNQDFDFSDAGEFFSNGNITNYSGTENISITVPANALPGTTRMRVMCKYNSTADASQSCVVGGNYGEYEDYSLLIRNVLPYSAGVANNGWANPTVTLNNLSTCQTTVSLNANCGVYNGSNWNNGSYAVIVNGTNIGTYNGPQTINLTSYIPVNSVVLDPTESYYWTSVDGTVQIISNSLSTPTQPTTSNVSYCQNETASQLTATLTGTGTTLKWYTSAQGHGYSATAPTPGTASVGTTSYWVSEAEPGGCESPRKKIDVTINALPAAPSASNQGLCSNSIVDDLVPAMGSTYSWYDGPGSTSPLTSGTSLNAGNYYVSQVDGNGCVSPKTTVEVSFLDNSSTISETACSSYYWSAADETYTSSGMYDLVLTNVAGCDSTVTLNLTITEPTTGQETYTACEEFTWDTDGQTYTSSGIYTAVLTNSVGCDSVVTLNLTINQPTTGAETQTACGEFTWSADGQTYTSTGIYTALLTNIAGCDSIVTLDLTINDYPLAAATDNGDGTISASVGTAYQWYDCGSGNPISGADEQTYAPAVNGNYAVEVTNAAGCSEMSSCVLIDYLGIENQTVVEAIVYPNPTTDLITVQLNVLSTEYTLTDANGRIVQAGNITSGNTIDLSSFESGVYFLGLKNTNGLVVKQVVKK